VAISLQALYSTRVLLKGAKKTLTAYTDAAKTVTANFTTVEQLVIWAVELLAEANPGATLSAAGGYPELIIQEAIYPILKADGTQEQRSNLTCNLPLAADWRTDTRTWLKAQEISTAAIPARFLA
jgi:hypothetical protein